MATTDVQSNIRELEALRTQTRRWRWGVTLAMLALVLGCVLTLRTAVTGLTQPGLTQQAFVKDLGDRLQQSAVPAIEQMGTQALHEIDFQAEVQKLNRRTPELAQAGLQQVKLLSADLPHRGERVLNATFGTALKQRQSKIHSLFPEATDEQVSNVLTNLTNEAQEQVADVNDTLLGPHKKALDRIVADFNTIQNEEAPQVRGQQPDWGMALLIFDLARDDLKSLVPEESKPGNSTQRAKGSTL